MSYKDYPYELYIENRNEKEHYFISFVDVNREKITVEISQSIYLEFETFRKADKRNENFWDRHMEQITMTDEALYNRAKKYSLIRRRDCLRTSVTGGILACGQSSN